MKLRTVFVGIPAIVALSCLPGSPQTPLFAAPAPAAVQDDSATLTVISPGFERAAAGPNFFFRLRGAVFGAVDTITRKIVFFGPDGGSLGFVRLPADFDARDIDIGQRVVLKGDTSEVAVPSDLDWNRHPDLSAQPLSPPQTVVSRAADSGTLIVTPSGGHTTLTVTPDAGGRVLTAEFIGADAAGQLYVYSENQPGPGGSQAIFGRLSRFSSDGRPIISANIGLSGFTDVPALPAAVGADGSALVIETKASGVRLASLRLSSTMDLVSPMRSIGQAPSHVLDLGPTEPVAAPAPRANDLAGRLGPAAYDPVAAADVLARARAYLTATWTMLPEDFSQPGIENSCVKTAHKYWRRPIQFTAAQIGTRMTDIPYRWAGFDSVASYQAKVSQPHPFLAGSICTCRENEYNQCVAPTAAGVDCSGFVSRAWGLTAHAGTGELMLKSDPLPGGLQDLQPGDALDRPGSHVRLFEVRAPGANQRYRVIEAALSCPGGNTVCEKIYTPAQLAGYRPIRLRSRALILPRAENP